jgi:aerobic-type carbon monoxide dehydrogenase small subunit (CoxS/CutS family)
MARIGGSMKLTAGGKACEVDAPGGMPLLRVLRDVLGPPETTFGGGVAHCAACRSSRPEES